MIHIMLRHIVFMVMMVHIVLRLPYHPQHRHSPGTDKADQQNSGQQKEQDIAD